MALDAKDAALQEEVPLPPPRGCRAVAAGPSPRRSAPPARFLLGWGPSAPPPRPGATSAGERGGGGARGRLPRGRRSSNRPPPEGEVPRLWSCLASAHVPGRDVTPGGARGGRGGGRDGEGGGRGPRGARGPPRRLHPGAVRLLRSAVPWGETLELLVNNFHKIPLLSWAQKAGRPGRRARPVRLRSGRGLRGRLAVPSRRPVSARPFFVPATRNTGCRQGTAWGATAGRGRVVVDLRSGGLRSAASRGGPGAGAGGARVHRCFRTDQICVRRPRPAPRPRRPRMGRTAVVQGQVDGRAESVTLQTVCVWSETGVPIRAETSTARPGTGRVIMLRPRSLRGPRTAGPFLPASLPNPPRASISAAREHAIRFIRTNACVSASWKRRRFRGKAYAARRTRSAAQWLEGSRASSWS